MDQLLHKVDIQGVHSMQTLTMCLGDCVSEMKNTLAPRSIDVVVTSPPYNIGIDYNTYSDEMSREDYLKWTAKWATEVARVLKEDGSFFLNIGSKPTDPWVPFEVAAALRSIFHLQNVIHWVKSISISKSDVGNYPGISGDISVGHYKPINSNRFVNDCHEYIFHFTLDGKVPLDRLAIGVPYQDKSNISRWHSGDTAKQDLHCRGNTWFIPYETIWSRTGQRPHPATFPPRLPEMCLKLHGAGKGSLVLDPFAGLANTGVACARLGASFVGFEIDQEYLAEGVRRLEDEVRGLRAQAEPTSR